MIGQKQADEGRGERQGAARRAQRPQLAHPKTRRGGGQHHQSDSHQSAERLKPGDEVQNNQREEQGMNVPAAPAHRKQKAGIETLGDERAVNDRKRQQAQGRDRADQDERGIVDRQDRAEQQMQKIEVAAVGRDQQHAERNLGSVDETAPNETALGDRAKRSIGGSRKRRLATLRKGRASNPAPLRAKLQTNARPAANYVASTLLDSAPKRRIPARSARS